MKLLQNKKLMILLCVAGVLLLPTIIAILVSLPILPKLTNNNDWIGFWGGYLGSILGGMITLFVLKITIDNNINANRREEKIYFYNLITKLYASFGSLTGDLGRLINNYIHDNSEHTYDLFIQKCNNLYSIDAEICILLESRMETYKIKDFSDEFYKIVEEIDKVMAMMENREIEKIEDIRIILDNVFNEIIIGDDILVKVIKEDLYS